MIITGLFLTVKTMPSLSFTYIKNPVRTLGDSWMLIMDIKIACFELFPPAKKGQLWILILILRMYRRSSSLRQIVFRCCPPSRDSRCQVGKKWLLLSCMCMCIIFSGKSIIFSHGWFFYSWCSSNYCLILFIHCETSTTFCDMPTILSLVFTIHATMLSIYCLIGILLI